MTGIFKRRSPFLKELRKTTITKSTKARCQICSKLTRKTCSSVSIVNFEQVNAGSHPLAFYKTDVMTNSL